MRDYLRLILNVPFAIPVYAYGYDLVFAAIQGGNYWCRRAKRNVVFSRSTAV